jgi:hypothetical protein
MTLMEKQHLSMIVAVGAPYNDGNGSNSGHVRVFEWDDTDTAWNQLSS